MNIKYKREDFDILVPSSKSDKKPDDATAPPKSGSRSININEDEIESVKDWSEIEQDLKNVGLTGEEKPNDEKGQNQEKPSEGGEPNQEKPIEEKGQKKGEEEKKGKEEEKKGEGEREKESKSNVVADETAEEKASRLKREKIKNHNRIVTNLNNVKTFYKKNEKIMSEKVKQSFEGKISDLESIVKESEQELKTN